MYYTKDEINKTVKEYLLCRYNIDVDKLSHGMYIDEDTKIYNITDTHNPQIIYSAKHCITFHENDINIWLRSKKISNIKKRIN